MLSEIRQSQNDKFFLFSATWSSQIYTDKKQKSYCQMMGGGKNGELFNYYGISVWKNEKVLEMDNGDGYTTV